MWSKLTHALKPRQHEDSIPQPSTSTHGEVLSGVLEQHPNLSVFHTNSETHLPHPSPPSSPTKGSRRALFKRGSRIPPPREDDDLERASSPLRLPTIGIPKKVKSAHHLLSNNSQSLSRASADVPREISRSSVDIGRRQSHEMLRSPDRPNTSSSLKMKSRPSLDLLRARPSLDALRSHTPDEDVPPPPRKREDSDMRSQLSPPSMDPKFSSVRSILRDPKTPGTGQSVRFFSRDAYKVLTPDQSMDVDVKSFPPPPGLEHAGDQDAETAETFLERLARAGAEAAVASPNPHAPAPPPSRLKFTRPSVAEVFSPLMENKVLPATPVESPLDAPGSPSIEMNTPPLHDFSGNLLDMSRLEIPPILPGPGFNMDSPMLDSAVELNLSQDGHDQNDQRKQQQMTSTPYREKGKGKLKPKRSSKGSKESIIPIPTPVIDETIFHSQEKSPKLPAPLHDRSQSFSFGQTVFFSMNQSGSIRSSTNSSIDKRSSGNSSGEAPYPSSELRAVPSDVETTSNSGGSSSPAFASNRSRAMSDTVFHSMGTTSPIGALSLGMKAPTTKTTTTTAPTPPEMDINDESSADLVVYSPSQPEPDPFRANATTYYTPQTMIPTTPPQGHGGRGGEGGHVRRLSKEDSMIVSLQTQLALQTELCGQYETDLRARDELVDILGKKLEEVEKEDMKRRSVLRAWKKKVAELEKTCRYLQEEVDGSRQESMERSVMDEASGEALRMLHRQIAALEREKGDWLRREEVLRDELDTLETLVRERTDDVMRLKETLWNRDESERELKEGIREAKEQMEMMGNVSVAMVDEEELKKLVAESEQKGEMERERHRVAQDEWEDERAVLMEELDKTKGFAAELEQVQTQLKNRGEEYDILKRELEAQWENSEKATEKIDALTKSNKELVKERDDLKREIEELAERMSNMEAEWNESENKKTEMNEEIQEVWNLKDALEKERAELEDQLRQEQETGEQLEAEIQEREDRLAELDRERQFAVDNVARLEENIRKRDQELEQYSHRINEREAEAEQLREEMSNMKREHAHALDQKTRALEDAVSQSGDAQTHLDDLVRYKAEKDVEMRASVDRMNALTSEVERLRRQVHDLQQESADKEVKILQITKQRSQDKEDLQGLNIALDSKQQELELIKRKLGLRGTAGSTPAQPSKMANRRDSAIFTTPGPSRPPSVTSESGTRERKASTETPSTVGGKPSALGRSVRINNTNSTASSGGRTTPISSFKTTRATVEGSMGPPPPVKGRVSVVGTPTPLARNSSLSKSASTSAKPTALNNTASLAHRRVSSLTMDQAVVARRGLKPVTSPTSTTTSVSGSERGEKENVETSTPASVKRRSLLPVPA